MTDQKLGSPPHGNKVPLRLHLLIYLEMNSFEVRLCPSVIRRKSRNLHAYATIKALHWNPTEQEVHRRARMCKNNTPLPQKTTVLTIFHREKWKSGALFLRENDTDVFLVDADKRGNRNKSILQEYLIKCMKLLLFKNLKTTMSPICVHCRRKQKVLRWISWNLVGRWNLAKRATPWILVSFQLACFYSRKYGVGLGEAAPLWLAFIVKALLVNDIMK